MKTDKNYYVYIMSNARNTVLYTGVTNDILRRVGEHKEVIGNSFTSKYHIHKLVYYELFDNVEVAIAREKQIKAGSRKKKLDLVVSMNPGWNDLSMDFD